MARSIKSKKEVNIPSSYELENAEFVKEVDSFILTLKHKLSGARVLILSNEDNNKVFSIGFRTPPKDQSGVPHIIEHTVLCGSKNFPAKDPFVELVKGSLNTYLNATTYPDKTLYPVASCNDKDFDNLMHVYMDAVLYPNIYKYEEIFKQEGWHYELEDKDSPIIYNGVVYNEMKGAYSSEESVLERFVMASLFPDNAYSQESGGDPKYIPDLSYEEYLDFHRKYYHPVNSYIYLYGDIDIEQKLNWMDENYLSSFPAIDIDSEIKFQKPFDKMKSLSGSYAAATDADCSEKTYYAFATAMDVTLDQNICRAFELLSYVLAEMPGAPLKQAILDAGIGTDVDVEFCDILRQSYFCITTKNAKPELREKFYDVIKATLEKVVKEGVDRKALEAAINGTEFKEREADFGSFPKGLLFGLKTMKTWLYDDNCPYDSLCYDRYYDFLREKLDSDYYEQLIQKYILDNNHAVLIEMKPEPGLAVKTEQETIDKLAKYKESLSDEEIDKLIADTKALKKYQEEPTPKEVLEKIPMLTRKDIGKKVVPYNNEETDICGIKTVYHEIQTNDIVYLDMFFDIADLKGYVPQMSFMATLLGYMDTKKHSYREFDTEVNFYTGGITSDVDIYCHMGENDSYEIKYGVRTKVLRSQISHALELMSEMMFDTLFIDEKHLREVVAESRSRLKVRLMSSGHQAAAGRTTAGYSESAWLNDHSVGIGYYNYLVQLDEHFEEEKDKLIAGCQNLLKAIFKKENLIISCIGAEDELRAVKDAMPSFIEKIDKFQSESPADLSMLDKYIPNPVITKEAYTTPAEIQYVALGGSFADVPDVNIGALKVVSHLLNYVYLWNEVRVKGGAYGVSCRFNREKEGFFTSYRDPNLSATLDVYRKAADYLAEFDADEREITKTIIGTISGMDTPLTPAMRGRRSMVAYFTKTPIEVLQRERDQVLACDKEDIRKLADVIRAVTSQDNLCVIGNEKHIEDDSELFETIKTLS